MRSKTKITVIFLLLALCSEYCFAGLIYPTAEITLRVTDTNGVPIQDADVSVVFVVPKGTGLGLGVKTTIVKGKTNKEGLSTASGTTTEGVTSSVIKEGYYRGGGGRVSFTESSLGRWQPWNPTVEVVLKEKKNPIPMYAKGTFGYIEVPVIDQPIGYDLEKGGWVTPYGEGIINDFIFVFKVRYDSLKDWSTSYSLTFSNTNDGIIEYYPDENDTSAYKWPYEAPEVGYNSEIERFEIFTPNGHSEKDYDEKRRYIFRVRTKVDSNGNIIEAMYGKMTGDIDLLPNRKVAFSYYLNPTGTRNLEFSGENLFTSDKNKYPY